MDYGTNAKRSSSEAALQTTVVGDCWKVLEEAGCVGAK
jgi:hypothetical protein